MLTSLVYFPSHELGFPEMPVSIEGLCNTFFYTPTDYQVIINKRKPKISSTVQRIYKLQTQTNIKPSWMIIIISNLYDGKCYMSVK